MLKKRKWIFSLIVIALFFGCNRNLKTTPTGTNNEMVGTTTDTSSLSTSESMQASRTSEAKPDLKYSLAIFPFRIYNTNRATHGNISLANSAMIMASASAEYNQIYSKYSFYAFDSKEYPDIVFKLPIDDKELDQVWHRKHILAKAAPHVDRIIEYGKQIDVDLVSMLYVYQYTFDLYLIGIDLRKVFHSHQSNVPRHLYYKLLKRETAKLIDQFLLSHK